MDNVIDVQNLFREYKQTRNLFKCKQQSIKAVNGVSFSVERGEIFGLLGAKWCRKNNNHKNAHNTAGTYQRSLQGAGI